MFVVQKFVCVRKDCKSTRGLSLMYQTSFTFDDKSNTMESLELTTNSLDEKPTLLKSPNLGILEHTLISGLLPERQNCYG